MISRIVKTLTGEEITAYIYIRPYKAELARELNVFKETLEIFNSTYIYNKYTLELTWERFLNQVLIIVDENGQDIRHSINGYLGDLIGVPTKVDYIKNILFELIEKPIKKSVYFGYDDNQQNFVVDILASPDFVLSINKLSNTSSNKKMYSLNIDIFNKGDLKLLKMLDDRGFKKSKEDLVWLWVKINFLIKELAH